MARNRDRAKRDARKHNRRFRAARDRASNAHRRRDEHNQNDRLDAAVDAEDFDVLSGLLQLVGAGIRPDSLLEAHPGLSEALSTSALFETAAAFGAMLVDSRLQSNCVRLEALVHVALATCNGSALPTEDQLAGCFNELDSGICGQMEDPAEDVFVSLVTTSEGNFRVLEGIWEAGGFYLQRVLDAVETFPAKSPFAWIRRRVTALLRLSEEACNRAGLTPYSVGEETPRATVTREFSFIQGSRWIRFDASDLARLGLTRADLDLFTFDEQTAPKLLTEPINRSRLQRSPVLRSGEQLALILPSAISYAIRTAVIEFLLANGMRQAFGRNLGTQYAALIKRTHLLGSFLEAPIVFSHREGLPIAELIASVDEGRFLHFIFFIDTLESFDQTCIDGPDPGPPGRDGLLNSRVRAAIEQVAKQTGFRGGVSLLVHCGIGRGIAMPIEETSKANWRVQFISISDLCTLSRARKFNALKLWKALDGVSRLKEFGIDIQNCNGLLNLIAWINRNDGHLVAHSQLPKGFRRTPHGLLSIAPNFVLDLRRQVAAETNTRGVPTVTGETEIVRHLNDSAFPEDNAAPVYAVDHFSADNGIPFVYLSDSRSWWCHAIPTANSEGNYDRWLMLKTWMPRIILALEPSVDATLNQGVLLRVAFRRAPDSRSDIVLPTREEIERSCSAIVDPVNSTITLTMGEAFDLGLAHPTNVSERVLVVAICSAFAQLASISLSTAQLRELEAAVVESDDARQMHAFQARTYRDFVQEDISGDVIELDDQDTAELSMGMAFRVESRETGRTFLKSKRQCTKLLNAIVRRLEDEICSDLRVFNRGSFIEMALRNYEHASADRHVWMRTARANIAIHRDKDAARDVIVNHDLKLNAALLPSRLLIEFAVCECPIESELRPGILDYSRLMAKANAIWLLGGWSDAIHYDAMKPNLRISALGDVQAETAFETNVLMPFSMGNSEARIRSAVDDYKQNFQLPIPNDGSGSTIDARFEDAWKAESGFSILELRRFIDAIEDAGIARKRVVYRLKRSELSSLMEGEIGPDVIQAILEFLSLSPRESWRLIPDAFHEKDIQPWRFRRQLSAIRRPLIRLDETSDPEFIIAPGLIRESTSYFMRAYYDGAYLEWQYRSKAMRSWCGTRANARGSEFAQLVASKIRESGWETADCEIDVKAVLNCRHDAEFGDLNAFGDIDVLAWNNSTMRVLVIECKHLHFHKTAGEIAEQLSDYRGRTKRNGKPDDLLKHLNRLQLMRARKAELSRFIRLDGDVHLEGWILFKNPVPMLYAWKNLENKVQIATFDDIEQVLSRS